MFPVFCVPWRPSPERTRLLDVVRAYYERTFPVSAWYFADSDGPEFSRSQAINKAVEAAQYDGHKLIVINDADTMATRESIENALALTKQDQLTRLPYDEYILMTQPETEDYIVSGRINGRIYDGAVSGVIVTHVDSFVGFDERFTGWGAEDVEFAIRSKIERVPGRCWALLHTAEQRDVSFPRNRQILRDTHGQHL